MVDSATSKKVYVLNTGGFSGQFFQCLCKNFINWEIEWLAAEELVDRDDVENIEAVVIVADQKFADFCASLPTKWQVKARSYQDVLPEWSDFSNIQCAAVESDKEDEQLTNSKTIAIVLNQNKGYRKSHYAVLSIIESLGWQPILFVRRALNDEYEQRFPTILVSNNFELALAIHKSSIDLLIADNDIRPEMMQRFDMPRLYIPHGVVGLLEHFVDMRSSQRHMYDLIDGPLMRSFTHTFLPTESILNAYVALYEDEENKPDTWLIPGGYLNLDLAISNVDESSERSAILYCPCAIPQSDDYSQRIPVNFPESSLDILEALLTRFPSHDIIFRHHPSAVEEPHFKEAIELINKKLENKPRYIYDTHPTHKQSFSQAQLAVSDASSSAYTFSLSHHLPTVSFLPGFEEKPLQISSKSYVSARQHLGAVETGNVENLMDTVEKLLNAADDVSDAIKRYRQREYFNVGTVAKSLEQTLVSIVERETLPSWVSLVK